MYCPKCGKATFKRHEGNEYRCLACDFTYFHNVATAVAAMIVFEEQILLVKRAVNPGYGKLDLPGGFVDPHESVEEALKRELEEELNFNIQQSKYLFSFPNEYKFKDVVYNTCDAFFVVNLDTKRNVTIEEAELLGHVWMPLKSVPIEDLAFDSVKKAVSMYRTNAVFT